MDNLRVQPETEIGPLPEEWEVKRLEELISYRKGKKPQTLVKEYDSENLPYLTADYFRTGEAKQHVPKHEIKENIVCEEHDTVLIWDGSNSGDVFTGLRGVLASTMVKVLPEVPELYGSFIYFFLRTQFDLLNSQTTGSTIPHVNKNLFRNLPIPLPPLPEQKAIAHVLRTVQKAIESTEKVIEASRELKRSLMNHLFTYGPVSVDEAEQVPLKETEIGPVPEHWDEVKLGDVAHIGNGSTPKRTNSAYWEGGTFPWLTSGKVHEVFIKKADEYVTEAAQNECHLPLVPKGSVVVAITGQGKTLGNAALVTFDTSVSQHLAYLRFRSPTICPEFVLAFLQWRYKNLRRAGREGGSTKGALTCGFLKSYSLPLPPLEEQQEIARMLEAVDDKITVEESRKRTLDVLFKTLSHNLMTGKVRVSDVNVAILEEVV